MSIMLQSIFDMARKWRERHEARAAFGAYLSKDALDDIVNRPNEIVLKPEKATIPYVIFQVRDDPLEDIQGYLSRAITVAVDRGGFVDTIASSIVSVVMLQRIPGFTVFQPVPNSQEPLVSALLQTLGANVRVVYGCAEGLWGNVGASYRLHYGAMLPRFVEIVETLGRLEFGAAMKIE